MNNKRKMLHKSQWDKTTYDPSLCEYEEAKYALPYTDGVVEYIKKHDHSVEIVRVRLTESEWNAMRGSRAMQRFVLQ